MKQRNEMVTAIIEDIEGWSKTKLIRSLQIMFLVDAQRMPDDVLLDMYDKLNAAGEGISDDDMEMVFTSAMHALNGGVVH